MLRCGRVRHTTPLLKQMSEPKLGVAVFAQMLRCGRVRHTTPLLKQVAEPQLGVAVFAQMLRRICPNTSLWTCPPYNSICWCRCSEPKLGVAVFAQMLRCGRVRHTTPLLK